MAKSDKYFDPRKPGWMNDDELAVIRAAVSNASDVLEVGCYCGRTTLALLEGSKGLVVAIDPLHRNGWMPSWPEPACDGLYLDSHRHMAKLVAEYPQRLVVFPVFSAEVFTLFRRKVDALVIDADHSYQSTKNEIDAFAPLVPFGGVIVLDDFDMEPVSSAWRDSEYRRVRPWLVPEVTQSIAVVRVVQEPPQLPPEVLATPAPEAQ